MAAGESDIVEVYNAGNAPKQRSMASSWEKMSEPITYFLHCGYSQRIITTTYQIIEC